MSTPTKYRAMEPFRSLWDRDFLGEDLMPLWSRWPMAMRETERSWDWTPRFDVVEKPESFVFKAEVPGMDAEDVDVTLTGDRLTIKGEKRKEEHREEDHVRITERSYGTFERAFTLPAPVNAESLEAEMRNGVLEIRVMKTRQGKPAKVKVKAR